MEAFALITRFSSLPSRTSGRDLAAVRRPSVAPRVEPQGEYEAELDKPGHVAGQYADDPTVPASATKAELVALAEERGIDASGTKADIIERLSDD